MVYMVPLELSTMGTIFKKRETEKKTAWNCSVFTLVYIF